LPKPDVKKSSAMGASGAVDSRKGLTEAIEFARRGDTLVV